MTELDTFKSAIQALFGPDPIAQQQANQWLTNFALTTSAWEASLSILEFGLPVNVLFFSANMLLSKTRTDWGRLTVDQRGQLTGAIRYHRALYFLILLYVMLMCSLRIPLHPANHTHNLSVAVRNFTISLMRESTQ